MIFNLCQLSFRLKQTGTRTTFHHCVRSMLYFFTRPLNQPIEICFGGIIPGGGLPYKMDGDARRKF